jgi:hypothetical protein
MYNASRAATPPLQGASKVFVQRVLEFMVSAAIGLTPFLGKAGVPGFTSILALYPQQLQSSLVPLSSFVMGAAVVATDFFLRGKTPSESRARSMFRRMLLVMGLALMGILTIYTLAVAAVPFNGGESYASFVVGFPPRRHMSELCKKSCEGVSAPECIKRQTGFRTDVVTSCFGETDVALASLAGSICYLTLMGTLAAMIGLGIVTYRRPRSA